MLLHNEEIVDLANSKTFAEEKIAWGGDLDKESLGRRIFYQRPAFKIINYDLIFSISIVLNSINTSSLFINYAKILRWCIVYNGSGSPHPVFYALK